MAYTEINGYKRDVMMALFAKGYKVQAHEDKTSRFISDVSFSGNYVDGWLEVKYCAKVPKSLDSIEHWTKGQEEFLRERGQAGCGHCYLLVGTPKLHALWRWNHLKAARPLKWVEKGAVVSALDMTTIQAASIAELAEKFSHLVRIRG